MVPIIKDIRLIFKIVTRNWYSLLCFEIIYKIIGLAFLFPLLQSILSLLPRVARVSYMTQYNFGHILKNPLGLLLILLFLMLFSYYVYFECIALAFYCEMGWQLKDVSALELSRVAFKGTLKVFHYKNLPATLVLLVITPFSVFSYAYGHLHVFRQINFVLNFFRQSNLHYILYGIIIVIINILLILYLFSFPWILKGESFLTAFRNSHLLLHKKWVKTGSILAFLLFAVAVVLIIAFFIIILFFVGYSNFNAGGQEARQFFESNYLSWSKIGTSIAGIFCTVVLFAVIVALNHKYSFDAPAAEPEQVARIGIKKTLFTGIFLILLLLLYHQVQTSKAFAQEWTGTEVIAHRAGAYFAPENTLSALDKAYESGADMAEIDVQQINDGNLIVMHDNNFSRTTGENQKIQDVDLATVKTYDAGAYFSSAFKGEEIPTLVEMIQSAAGRIDLMIELKASGTEIDLEEKTIELIQENNVKDEVMVASMSLDCLKKVKEIDPTIKTVYITRLLLLDEYNLDYVDSYSLRISFLTPAMISQIHLQGKKVYSWTINSETMINKALQCQVDGIVTDNPDLVYYFIQSSNQNRMLDFLLKTFYPNKK